MNKMLTLLGIGIGVVIAAPFAALRWLLTGGPWRATSNDKAAASRPSPTAVAPAATVVALPGAEVTEPSIIRRVTFGPPKQTVGEITLWLQPTLGWADRAVRFTDPVFVERFGERKVKLPRTTMSAKRGCDEVVADTIREVQMACERREAHKPTGLVEDRRPVSQAKTLARSKSKPEQSANARWSTAAQAQESHVGRLVASGWDKRTIRGEEVEMYFADLRDATLGGALVRVWGNDLERALAAAGAENGDQIAVAMMGRAGRKKIYEVEKTK